MNDKDAYIEHLENTIKDLQNQVSNLTEMVLLLRKELYSIGIISELQECS